MNMSRTMVDMVAAVETSPKPPKATNLGLKNCGFGYPQVSYSNFLKLRSKLYAQTVRVIPLYVRLLI